MYTYIYIYMPGGAARPDPRPSGPWTPGARATTASRCVYMYVYIYIYMYNIYIYMIIYDYI